MRVAFLTLGCKVNYYETEKMKKQFEKAGHMVVSFEEDAEVYIINTCTVTNIADRKSRKMIHRAGRKNPEALVVVTGCYVDSSERKGKQEEMIDLYVPNEQKEKILELVLKEADSRDKKGNALYCNQNTSLAEDKNLSIQAADGEGAGSHLHYSEEALKEKHTRAYLNVQNGCNQYCTYCIIPYVRGPLKSRPQEEVLKEVERLAWEGVLEIVLTGIHLSSYGVDFTEQKSFLDLEGKPLLELIRKIAEVEGIKRIRLGSLEPRIITESFAEALSKIKEVCPHFHLSLQSGCDSVLKRMNRHYTTEEYASKAEILRKYFHAPALTTDIIVGFPGETEEEFRETLQFVKQVNFSKIHVFKYSRRKGTMADAMEHQISESEKGKRSDRMLLAEQEMGKKYREYFPGRRENVLFEEVERRSDGAYLTGYNERYVRIIVKAENEETARKDINTIQRVEILKSMEDGSLLGKMGMLF